MDRDTQMKIAALCALAGSAILLCLVLLALRILPITIDGLSG